MERMSTVRRRFAVLLVVLLGAGGAVGVTGPAVAAPAPGTVLSATTVALPAPLNQLARGKRIEYVSTNVNGGPITVTGLVMTPTNGKTDKIVAWAHGSTGLADICAPSNHYDVFWPEARIAVAGLLSRGWTVAATDYAGLGTPEPHPYFIGSSEARAIIDSVKAARNLDRTLSTQYVVEGHSQGGQGALFADEMAPGYDGPLVLRGVVAIAPVSNVDLFAPFIPGTPGQGYLVMALVGLATVEPRPDPLSVLAKPARDKLPVVGTSCLNEILDAYSSLTASQLLTGGALPQWVVDELVRWDNPAQVPPTAPILVVQGTADEAVPVDITDALVYELRGYNQPVRYLKIAGADHEGAVTQSVPEVTTWIAARFS
jgi:pimeloyl-ACP methyl ester carboxylesterase